MFAIAAYGVQCLAASCWGQVQGSRVRIQEEGCCAQHPWTRTLLPCTCLELLMMGIEVPETC